MNTYEIFEKPIKVPAEAIAYIEKHGERDPFKFEVVELFFQWLRQQPNVEIEKVLHDLLGAGAEND
jgi:hypothetical protein